MTDSVFISIAIKIALILLIIYVVGLYKKYRDEKENLPSGNPSNDDEDTAGNVSNAEREPMQILISSLRELNADYKVDRLKDGDEVIYFMFQAENFSLQVS